MTGRTPSTGEYSISWTRFNQKGKIWNFVGNDPKKFLKNVSGTSESVLSEFEHSFTMRSVYNGKNDDAKFRANLWFFTNYGFCVFQFLEIKVFTFFFEQKPTNCMVTFLLCPCCDRYLIKSDFYSFETLPNPKLALWSSKPSHFRYQPSEASGLETDHTNEIRVAIYPPLPSFE